MGITGIHAIPMMITYMLQGTLCDTGIPCTFYGENICSVFTSIEFNILGNTYLERNVWIELDSHY